MHTLLRRILMMIYKRCATPTLMYNDEGDEQVSDAYADVGDEYDDFACNGDDDDVVVVDHDDRQNRDQYMNKHYLHCARTCIMLYFDLAVSE